jgi:hypothetical protein
MNNHSVITILNRLEQAEELLRLLDCYGCKCAACGDMVSISGGGMVLHREVLESVRCLKPELLAILQARPRRLKWRKRRAR